MPGVREKYEGETLRKFSGSPMSSDLRERGLWVFKLTLAEKYLNY